MTTMTKAELLAALEGVPDATEVWISDNTFLIGIKAVHVFPIQVELILSDGTTLAPDLGKDRTLEWNLWRVRHGKAPMA